MNTKINFFEMELVAAIKAGIYEIHIRTSDKEGLLYIGESVSVLVRCATHLYKIAKGNGYLGFTLDKLENNDIELVFKLFKSIDDKKVRKSKEKELISERNPILQSGISDRVKSIEDMINVLTDFLKV